MESSELLILARENLEYRDGKLFWRKARGGIKPGDRAGCLDSNGYGRIMLNGKRYREHRIIFLMFNPNWNIFDRSFEIDHINHKRNDNRIENLRLVTRQENQFNRRKEKSKGYTWHKRDQKFYASIQINGKSKHLGCFDNEKDARSAYLKAKEKYHVIAKK